MNNQRPEASLKIVYLSLIISTFIYAVVVWVMFGQREATATVGQELRQPYLFFLILMSAVAFGISLFIGAVGSADTPEGRRASFIKRWSIAESATIFALIAAFFARDWRLFPIGWVLTLTSFALSFPSDEQA